MLRNSSWQITTFFIFYVLLSISLLFYSFTQVDLGLTLTKVSIWQGIETAFQHIGYFQRPLSSQIFIIIVSLMLASYLLLLHLSFKKKIGRIQVWTLLIVTAIVLTFSYNAFSHDLFNYIFDAKILTHYQQNPYEHKALDYSTDPMLSFMQWTHRTYPYGPAWLLITAPLTLIGGNIFLLTFFLFKITIASFFLGSAFLIEKIARIIKQDNPLFPLVFFAFNPLIIIECLVSGHNDIAMAFFSLLGIYFLVKRRIILAIIFVLSSGLIKFIGFVLIPAFFIYSLNFYKNLKFTFNKLILFCLLLTLTALFYVLSKIELQPWYLVWILPLIALIRPNKYFVVPSFIVSCALLFTYSIFLLDGNWNRVTPALKFNMLWISVAATLLVVFLIDRGGKFLKIN